MSDRMRTITKISVALAAYLIFLQAQASSAPGWRWYNEPRAVVKPKPKKTPRSNNGTTVVTTKPMTATQQMQWFHQYHQEVKTDAVLNPTDLEKVKKVMVLNKYLYDQSGVYGMTMKKALLDDPSLSYTINRPTQQAARQGYLAEVRQQKLNAIDALVNKGYGLFFVYKGESVIARQLAPSIQDFADRYGIELLGVSLDGQELASIHRNRENKGQLVVDADPALLLVNPKTKSIKPLAYGFIAQEALLGRFLNVATNYAADF